MANARLAETLNARRAPPQGDAARLARIRDRHMNSGAGALALAVDSARALTLEGFEPGSGETGRIALFEPHVGYATVEFLASAHPDIAFLLDLVARALRSKAEDRETIRRLTEQLRWYDTQSREELPDGEAARPTAVAAHAAHKNRPWPEAHGREDTNPEGAQSSEAPPDAEGARPNGRRPESGAPSGAQAEGRYAREDKTKDHAAEAAMRCADRLFMAFLAERQAAPCPDADAAARLLRQALAVTSRKHLNTNPRAAARWRDLRAEFDAWRKT